MNPETSEFQLTCSSGGLAESAEIRGNSRSLSTRGVPGFLNIISFRSQGGIQVGRTARKHIS